MLGGRLEACFVSKDDVARWPVVGTVARLGRTVFVSRQRGATGRERDAMRDRLAAGDNLMLFPEGTTSDGSRVLPFRSSFFAIAEGADRAADPAGVAWSTTGLAGCRRDGRAGRSSPGTATWIWRRISGAWRSIRGLRATVLLHAPLDPARFANRKALAQAVWQTVADGAAKLRQNRPVEAPARGARSPGACLCLNVPVDMTRQFLSDCGPMKVANPRCCA